MEILRRYVIEDTIEPCRMDKIQNELRRAKQVIMKTGFPNGKDADECLIIYVIC